MLKQENWFIFLVICPQIGKKRTKVGLNYDMMAQFTLQIKKTPFEREFPFLRWVGGWVCLIFPWEKGFCSWKMACCSFRSLFLLTFLRSFVCWLYFSRAFLILSVWFLKKSLVLLIVIFYLMIQLHTCRSFGKSNGLEGHSSYLTQLGW